MPSNEEKRTGLSKQVLCRLLTVSDNVCSRRKAKTLAAIIPVSIEMLEDASNAGQIIESALRASMGQKLDQAALIGTGAESEPKGIRNHASINTISSVGTPADYGSFSLAIGDIMAANYPGEVSGLAWINHPRTDDTLDGLQDTTNQPLMPTPRVAELQRYSTTALPITEGGSSDESVSIVGDFSQLAFGMRTNGVVVRIAVERTRRPALLGFD